MSEYLDQLTINNIDYDIHAKNVVTDLKDLTQDDEHQTVTSAQKLNWTAKANVSDIPTDLSQLTATTSNSRHLTDSYISTWNAKADIEDIPDETAIASMGFTKNVGTITGVRINGTLTSSGIAELGTVLTEHQSLSSYRTSSTQDIIDTALSDSITNLSTQKLDKPADRGSNGYVLTTDGQGSVAWSPAQSYTLPVATSSILGGIKSGTDIFVDANGNVSVLDDSHNHIIDNIDNLQTTLGGKQKNIYQQADAPSNPSVDDLWINTNDEIEGSTTIWNTETWTFKLLDGTTITRSVVIL